MMWLFLSLISAVFAQTSYVPLGQVLKAKGYEFSLSGKSWVSNGQFDSSGVRQAFLDNNRFAFQESELKGAYGTTKDLQFYASVIYRQVQNTSTIAAQDYEATNSGLQSYGAGMMFAFDRVDKVWQYALELNYRQTPYTNERALTSAITTDDYQTILLGDDGADFSAGVNVSYISPQLHSFGSKILYRKPGKNLSDEINWRVEGAIVFPWVSLIAGIEGINSLKNDPYTNDLTNRLNVRNRGSTSIFDSINRELVAPYAGLHIALGKTWRVETRFQTISRGKNTDSGQLLSLTLARRVGSELKKEIVDQQFKTYDVEANVTKVSKKKEYVVIDKGFSSGLEVGMRFDLFQDDYVGGNTLLARGVIVRLRSDQAILKVTSRFTTQAQFKEGMTARGFKR
jgi:hypothetical protein